MEYKNTQYFACQLDQEDSLRSFRDRFYIPERNGQSLVYFCGNSLGLQPKTARTFLDRELAIWQQYGVEGWAEKPEGQREEPWLTIHKRCKAPLATIVGAEVSEVVPMNNLTVNLHLLLASFYQPTGKKTKILTIGGDFPSDQYALETHVAFRGLSPSENIVEIFPRSGEHGWRMKDLLDAISHYRDSLALVLMSGLHYYTGQFFDLAAITQKAHEFGIPVGFDLAHAVGNVPLQLHEWGIDFAFWCSYKYLNSGPGGVSGIFVHTNHHSNALRRLAGWWGYDEVRRFEMAKGFVPMSGADGWQLSTPSVLTMAVHQAAVDISAEAGMERLREKSEKLTGYLAYVLRESRYPLEIMTPTNPAERGCQLSLLIQQNGKQLFNQLVEQGVIGDWREPNCIRLAPTPLYNTFEEVWQVGQVFSSSYLEDQTV